MEEIKEKKGSEQPHFLEIIAAHNISVIRGRDEIDKIFNISTLDREEPEIFTEDDSIIIFDTPDFNSAYILDELKAFLEGLDDYDATAALLMPVKGMDAEQFDARRKDIHRKLLIEAPKVKLYYIDDEELHSALFEPFLKGRNSPTTTPPALLMVSPKSQIILIDAESMFPIDARKILMAYLMLEDSENFKANMLAVTKTKKENQ